MRRRAYPSLGPNGFHRIAYTEWGDPRCERVVICVHGLTRNGRDFDDLAGALSDRYRVVCPDVAGRGESDWLATKADYGYPLYCADMAALVARLDVAQVFWVGTSMGGLVGMLLAARPRTPIRALVMNDVGPFLPRAALARIVAYVGNDPRFPDLAALDAYLQQVYAPFGPFTPEQWQGLVQSTARRTAEGDIGLNYDPGIAGPLRAMPLEDVDLWAVWDAVDVPAMVLHGEHSDVLLPDTAAAMRRRGPRAEVLEIPGVGHAPTLMSADQIAAVGDWLDGVAQPGVGPRGA